MGREDGQERMVFWEAATQGLKGRAPIPLKNNLIFNHNVTVLSTPLPDRSEKCLQ